MAFHDIIGTGAQDITWWQMICRGVLIFFYTLLLVRFGGRRVFGKYTSFDIVLGIILGSIMSRALTGNARFFPTLAAATALVLLHRLLSELAFRFHWLGYVIKGRELLLVRKGKIQPEAMRAASMTERDVLETLRSQGGTASVENVEAAYLERSGNVSVIVRNDSE